MKEVIAIIRPETWAATLEATEGIGTCLVTYTRVLGRGRQQGIRYMRPFVQGQEGGIAFLPKRLISWIVPDEAVPSLTSALIRANQTGNHGDGKVFICPVVEEPALAPAVQSEREQSRAEKGLLIV